MAAVPPSTTAAAPKSELQTQCSTSRQALQRHHRNGLWESRQRSARVYECNSNGSPFAVATTRSPNGAVQDGEGAGGRTPARASSSGVRSEENVPPGGALDNAPSIPAPTEPAAASRPPLRAIQPQGQPRPLGATPKKGSGVKEAAAKGKKPSTGESSVEVPRPKVRDAILFWEENRNRNRNVQSVSSTRQQDECSDNEGSIFSIRLKRTQASLEKALDLNVRYQQDLASRSSVEQDKDKTLRQVEDELAKVITSLTEEGSSLRQQLDASNRKEEYYVSILKRKEEAISQMESRLDQSKRVYESRLKELEKKMQKMDDDDAAHG